MATQELPFSRCLLSTFESLRMYMASSTVQYPNTTGVTEETMAVFGKGFVIHQVNQPVRTTQQNLHHSAAQAQISTRQNLIFLMQSCVLWIFSLPATKPPSFNHREPQKTEGKDKSHIREQSNKHIPENC